MFTDHLNLPDLNSLLSTRVLGKAPGWNNEVWDTIDSTNIRALELAKQGAPEGLIVAARQQTAGRGRLGRTWVSPPDAGLYISFVLQPRLPVGQVTLLSFAAGLAVVDAIAQECGIEPGVKWVNDIVFGGKKLAGILCEMVHSNDSRMPTVVAGIGINLRRPQGELPADVAAVAVYLEDITGAPVNATRLAAALAKHLEARYRDQLAGGGKQALIRDWRKHAVTLGKRVKVITAQGEFEAVAKNVSNDGALIVETDDGSLHPIHAGDVSIRNTDGSYS